MKSHKGPEPEKPFVPITLTLESQAEVDALFAIFNHISVSNAVGLPYECYKSLEAHRSEANLDLYDKLDAILKPGARR